MYPQPLSFPNWGERSNKEPPPATRTHHAVVAGHRAAEKGMCILTPSSGDFKALQCYIWKKRHRWTLQFLSFSLTFSSL